MHKKLNDEWYYGKNRRGCEGMFPSSYINVKVPIRESSSTKSQPSQAMAPSPPVQKSEPTARALYNFTAETHEDLTLQVKKIGRKLSRIISLTDVNDLSTGKRYHYRPPANQRRMAVRSYRFQARSISSQFR